MHSATPIFVFGNLWRLPARQPIIRIRYSYLQAIMEYRGIPDPPFLTFGPNNDSHSTMYPYYIIHLNWLSRQSITAFLPKSTFFQHWQEFVKFLIPIIRS